MESHSIQSWFIVEGDLKVDKRPPAAITSTPNIQLITLSHPSKTLQRRELKSNPYQHLFTHSHLSEDPFM
ncbi:hypothetical protein FRC02_007813 [Tulasnella sp. 418]|nr:hypothetical protein FRC02_007813 [Tulasnella sp. 418]